MIFGKRVKNVRVEGIRGEFTLDPKAGKLANGFARASNPKSDELPSPKKFRFAGIKKRGVICVTKQVFPEKISRGKAQKSLPPHGVNHFTAG